MSFVAGLINMGLEALLEIDEMSYEDLPDGRVQVTFVTSGIIPTTTKIKTLIWALLGVPVQKVDSIEIREVQKGPIIKRYVVTVVLKPLIEGLKRGEGLGVIDVVTGKNVRVVLKE